MVAQRGSCDGIANCASLAVPRGCRFSTLAEDFLNPWDEVLTNLCRRIPEKTYQRFFLGSEFISLEDGIITIQNSLPKLHLGLPIPRECYSASPQRCQI